MVDTVASLAFIWRSDNRIGDLAAISGGYLLLPRVNPVQISELERQHCGLKLIDAAVDACFGMVVFLRRTVI